MVNSGVGSLGQMVNSGAGSLGQVVNSGVVTYLLVISRVVL